MNGALLSSKKMDYCTPRDFFAELDREFHFTLDAAATEEERERVELAVRFGLAALEHREDPL